MKGARQYAELFETGQYGRLYIDSGSHARGRTFHVFVLPPDEVAADDPLRNAVPVEVYGVVRGQPGWTEEYGWLYHGKWEQDFLALVEEKKAILAAKAAEEAATKRTMDAEEESRIFAVLNAYGRDRRG